MTRRAVRAVEVEYDDGTRLRYQGKGYADETRTPRAAQAVPVLRDDDISFLTVTLTYDRGRTPAAT